MIGQELKILFKKSNAYLTVDKSLTLEQAGLPKIATFFKSNAFWSIRVLNYIESERKIFCEILSYQIGDTEFDYYQQALSNVLNRIDKVDFRSINTGHLLRTLSGTRPVALTHPEYIPVERTQNNPYLRQEKIDYQQNRSIFDKFFVSLKNVHFKDGYVSFLKKLKDYEKTIEVTISNPDLRVEYDSIKNYFANVLNTKKIQVTIQGEIIDGKLDSLNASSPEIAQINRELLDEVKFNMLRISTKRKADVEIDQTLFTKDEYFETFLDSEFESDIFFKTDQDLFEDMLEISKTKHYRHLRFLSSKHLNRIMKLRFVHTPLSFIFLLQGKDNYYIIWETLDTKEATYIWLIEKDITKVKLRLGQVDKILKEIKVHGKMTYISSKEDSFKRIYHDYSKGDRGFIKWKVEIENILI